MSNTEVGATSYGLVTEQNSTDVATGNYIEYSKYVLETRALPSIIDGLKFVQRRSLYVGSQKPEHLVKLPNIMGDVIKLHPHGDSSISDAIVSLGRPSKSRLFRGKGNFGGYNFGAAAPRYLETFMESYSRFGFTQFVKYAKFVQGEVDSMEPYALPALIPYSLMDGAKGLGVGLSTDILSLNILDTIDYFKDVINKVKNPRIPRPDLGEVIIDMKDDEWKESVKGIRSRIRTKSLIVQESDSTLVIHDLYGRNINQVLRKIQKYIDDDIIDFRDESKKSMRLVFEIIDKKELSIKELKSILERATTSNTTFRRLVVDGKVAVYCDLLYQANATLKYLNQVLDNKHEKDIEQLELKIEVYKVINYLLESKLIDKISKYEYSDLVLEIKRNTDFDESTIKKALDKSIGYLTKSHSKEYNEALQELENVKNIDRSKYLNDLYDKYKELMKPLYDSTTHSIMSSELLENPRIKFMKRSKVIEIGNSGYKFNDHINKVYSDGHVVTTSISSQVKINIDTKLEDKTVVDIVPDSVKYGILVTNKGRALGIDTTRQYDKDIMKLDNDEYVSSVICADEKFTYKGTEYKNLDSFVKSRISIPREI